MEKWYAVMSKPRQERSSTAALEKAGIETYYPEVQESFCVRGRQHMRVSGLFPRYFFAKFDYASQFRTVSYCRGAQKIVAFGSVPAEVEPSFLDEIRNRLEQQSVIQIPSFKRGELVLISHGPLAGVKAVFDSSLSKKERVIVLLRTLFYQSRAVVQLSDIERYSEAV